MKPFKKLFLYLLIASSTAHVNGMVSSLFKRTLTPLKRKCTKPSNQLIKPLQYQAPQPKLLAWSIIKDRQKHIEELETIRYNCRNDGNKTRQMSLDKKIAELRQEKNWLNKKLFHEPSDDINNQTFLVHLNQNDIKKIRKLEKQKKEIYRQPNYLNNPRLLNKLMSIDKQLSVIYSRPV